MLNRQGQTLSNIPREKPRKPFVMASARSMMSQRGATCPELEQPASKSLRALAKDLEQAEAKAKVYRAPAKPGEFTAFLTSHDGKQLNVTIVASSQLAAIAVVRKAYPLYTVVKVR